MKEKYMRELKEELLTAKDNFNSGKMPIFDKLETFALFVILNNGNWFVIDSTKYNFFPEFNPDDIVFILKIRDKVGDVKSEFCNSDRGNYRMKDDMYGGFFAYLRLYCKDSKRISGNVESELKRELFYIQRSFNRCSEYNRNDFTSGVYYYVIMKDGSWFSISLYESKVFPSIDIDEVVFVQKTLPTKTMTDPQFVNSELGLHFCKNNEFFTKYLKKYGKEELEFKTTI